MRKLLMSTRRLSDKEKIANSSPYRSLHSASKGYSFQKKERRTKGYAHDFSNIHGWN